MNLISIFHHTPSLRAANLVSSSISLLSLISLQWLRQYIRDHIFGRHVFHQYILAIDSILEPEVADFNMFCSI